MTNEEKAEEYSDNLDLVKERNPELKTNDDFIKQAYLDGLAEGRKESILKKCATDCNIPEGCDVLMRYELLGEKNAELKAQIEKMKCCRNCKHFNQVEIHCDLYAKYECVNLDKWECM